MAMCTSKSDSPRALIIRTAGINCDEELAYAFSIAGAEPELVHLNTLMRDPARFDRYSIIALPGGFSYGDDVAGGAIFAMHVRETLYPAFRRAVAERAVPVFAVCNGFQVAAKVGLLPGPALGEPWPEDAPPAQTVTLTNNERDRFIDDWLRIEVNLDSACIWTRDIAGEPDTTMLLPIAHCEGRFVAAPDVIGELERSNLIALRYSESDNVNGSMNRIAGICDASGLIFGLMPHPERYVEWIHHPFWTRLDSSIREKQIPLGLQIFRNAVEHARSRVVTA